ncbi:hypothetical protein DFH08DRAFT_437045 [Mycena albidolilacea]|uniref:Uncharacterized protein n=1 Tax=Mycena albidolilacea TaxID=1033008 RepID=A0AAD7AFY4_9AGAR|nr:hypothetical protein DFH08DRAFT_437045 [Mycena albidolilacea]
MEGVQLLLAEMGEDIARNSRNTVKNGWLDMRRRMQKQRKANSKAGGEPSCPSPNPRKQTPDAHDSPTRLDSTSPLQTKQPLESPPFLFPSPPSPTPSLSSLPSTRLLLKSPPSPSKSNPLTFKSTALSPTDASSTRLDFTRIRVSSTLNPHQLKYSLLTTSPHLDLIYLLSTPCPSPRRKALQELVDSHRTRLECVASHRSIKR